MTSGQQETLVWDLRRLVAYHEWSSPPNPAAADVLQGGADALQAGAISVAAAEALVARFSDLDRSPRQELSSARDLAGELRDLCSRWSDSPAVVDALQEAASAYEDGALSSEHAETLITIWEPFARLDNVAARVSSEDTDPGIGLRSAIVADMRRMLAKETDPARKLHLARLLRDQVQRFREVR